MTQETNEQENFYLAECARNRRLAEMQAIPNGGIVALQYFIAEHLWISLIIVTACFVFVGAVLWNTPDGETERAARSRANLECRQSGGTYEYFGTEGYHCIGGKFKQAR